MTAAAKLAAVLEALPAGAVVVANGVGNLAVMQADAAGVQVYIGWIEMGDEPEFVSLEALEADG